MNFLKYFKLVRYKLISANRVAKLSGVTFGSNCKFLTKKFGSEPQLIKIGDDFYSSSNVQFLTHDGSVNVIRNLYKEYKNIDYFSPIVIGDNVFLGYGVVVLPGVIIGDNVIVGAGTIVRGELKSNSVYAGVPSKFICSLDEYLNKHQDSFIHTKNMLKQEKKVILMKKYLNKANRSDAK